MNNIFSYSMIYEILLNLREEFHSNGRIDDSNAKLDEIIKLICISFSLAKRGCKFNLLYVMNKSIELFGDEHYLAKTLRYIFEEESKMDMFYNDDNTNIFGANRSLNIQHTENEFAKKLIVEIEKIDFINLLENKRYEDFDLVNECFGHFVRENFRNNKEDAQYMTPYEIATPVLDIIFNDMIKDGYFTVDNIEKFTVMDPSCGVGTLLIECSNHFTNLIKNKDLEYRNIEKIISRFRKKGVIGQDKVDRMVRLSKINMLLLGGNMSNILNGNSIIGSSKLSTYKGKVDLIFTNPPFGAEYKISQLDLNDYPILKSLNLSSNTTISSELLMLDKCINMLKNDGYLAIVLPDSVFSARGINGVYRENILNCTEVRGIIELPDVTFAQAGTRTKTSILYLRKKCVKINNIFMAICDDLGYIVKEKVGVPVKISKGNNKMSLIAEKIIDNDKKEGIISNEPSITIVSQNQLIGNILKPGFYSVNWFKSIASIKNMSKNGFHTKKLADVVDFVTSERELCNVGTNIRHISVLHINSDCTINFREVEKYNPISKGRRCEEGDLIFSKINPRISRNAIVPKRKYELVCSNEFEIMKPKDGVDVYTLCFILQTKCVISQIENLTSGTSSSHCRIRREQLENIIIPFPVEAEVIEKFNKVNKKLKQTIDLRYKADKIMIKEIKYLESIF